MCMDNCNLWMKAIVSLPAKLLPFFFFLKRNQYFSSPKFFLWNILECFRVRYSSMEDAVPLDLAI